MGAWKNATASGAHARTGRPAGTTSVFDLDRWAPSDAAARFVEHFWSVSWDLRGQGPFDSTVITFPSLHLTHEWGDDGRATVSAAEHIGARRRGVLHDDQRARRVVGARFRPGGFAARFGRDAAALTGRVQPVDDELFGGPIHLDDDVDAASARLDELIGTTRASSTRPMCH